VVRQGAEPITVEMRDSTNAIFTESFPLPKNGT
jgi:hypothetical protein